MRDLKNKVAAITGAASGIGRGLAEALAKEGAELALSDIDEAGLDETRSRVAAVSPRVTTRVVDVADRGAVESWADEVAGRHERVNLIFNNAGVALSSAIVDMTYDDLEWLMGVNFWGVVHGTKSFLPHLLAARDGHVINVSSIFGIIAVPGQAAYHAAKFAVRGYTECLREELDIMDAGVSATSVHPGGIKTNIARAARMSGSTLGDVSADEAAEQFDRAARTTPDQAAAEILDGVRSNARRVLVGWDAKLMDAMQRALPTSYQGLVVRGAKMARARMV